MTTKEEEIYNANKLSNAINETARNVRQDTIAEVKKMIVKTLKRHTELKKSIRAEWKKEKSFPMYSNQFYASCDLQRFFEELNQKLTEMEKQR